MVEESFKELAAALTHTARSAGELILRYRGQNSDVTLKEDGSPVTHADQVAEELILNDLSRIAPGVTVVAEESIAVLPDGFNPDEPFFLVDPLDGTKDFIQGGKEFTVNIALVKKRRPVFGLIYAPALEVLYVTLSTEEAVCARLEPARSEPLEALTSTPMRTRAADSTRLKALVSRSHRNQETDRYVASLPISEAAPLGSSLKFAVLADGDADIYPRLSPTFEWDTAAGHAILSAAGGTVLTMDGQPLLYGKRETNLLNPAFIALGQASTAAQISLAQV
jgi:3'(2'), 5'-bisphosphate nucleotidase